MDKKKNNLPVVILLFLLILVLTIVVIFAIKGKVILPDTEIGHSEGNTPATEKWQEGIIKHNEKYYKFNNKIHTYLIMGIDKDGPVEDEMAEGTRDGGQSDAMFLLVTNSEDETMSVISINRNSMTEVTVYGEGNFVLGKTKAQICTQHGFGDGKKLSCSRTADAVSYLFYNIPIDGYFSINMGAIPLMNDAIGGTQVIVLNDLSYPDVNLKKGDTVNLMGMEAYYYLRGRDINEFDSATNRLRRQEQYITSYFAKMKEVSAGSKTKVLQVYESIEDYIVTNIDFVELVSELMSYEYDENRMYTVPGETIMGETYEEYHVDDKALYDMIIDVFYNEVDVKK